MNMIIELLTLKNIVGAFLIGAGILDAIKYLWHITAIKKAKTAGGHSRKFANAAITQDLVKLVYGFVIKDIYIIISTLAALITMAMYFYTIYMYYPYRNRKRSNFKRPNLLIYTINSLIPNTIRKHL